MSVRSWVPGAVILVICLSVFLLPQPGECRFRLCGVKLVKMLKKLCNGCLAGGTVETAEKRNYVNTDHKVSPNKETFLSKISHHYLPSMKSSLAQASSSVQSQSHPYDWLTPEASVEVGRGSHLFPWDSADQRSKKPDFLSTISKRGIIEECCVKRCSYTQLKSFCCDEE